MIVVDTDVVSAFWIRGDRTAAARKRDGDWVVLGGVDPVLIGVTLRRYMKLCADDS